MRPYRHFTIFEREKIFKMIVLKYSYRKIAVELQRNVSSISREVNANKINGKYSPSKAQKKYLRNKSKCGAKRKLSNPVIHEKVQSLFLDHQWSPEQISERLKYEGFVHSISYNTIYRGIYTGMLERHKLTSGQRGVIRKLRHKGKSRHTKNYEEKRGKIRVSNDLKDRPEEANRRLRIGDWEADTVLGTIGKACLVTLIDRKSRFLLCARIDKKNSINVRDSMINLLDDQPLYSITPDRGKEFSKHSEVTIALNDVQFYWPLPSHPWDRGSNENTNGLLREYFPKNEDMSVHSEEYVTDKIHELNKRPRKCLGWKSPYEVYYNQVLHLI